MSQITIRDLPDRLEREIRQRARDKNLSLNRVIRSLLEQALDMPAGSDKKRDLSEFAGGWTEEEANEFEENVAIFENIDEDLWEE